MQGEQETQVKPDAGENGKTPSLYLQHKEELRRSGLTDATISDCGFYSVASPAEVARILNWKEPGHDAAPALAIPFYRADGRPCGYVRLKLDKPRVKDGRLVKYESPIGLPNRAYFPPFTRTVLPDPHVPLLITEGEKKAAAAAQEGFACVGLVGVEGWSKRREADASGKKQGVRELLDDLAAIPWEGRVVCIVFDSDAAHKGGVVRAESSLALALEKMGAVVKIVRLPDGPGGEKHGLDDFLVNHGAEALRGLLHTARPVRREPKAQLPPYTPFPVESLPPPVKEYVEQAAKALGCDPAFVALPMLAVLASAIGNSRVIHVKRGWDEPSIIWSAVVSESGTLKTPAFKKVVSYLHRLQKRLINEHNEAMAQFQEEMQEYKAAKKAFKEGGGPDPGDPPREPVCKRIITDNITIEKLAELLENNPNGILSARDELASWFCSFRQYKSGRDESDMARWLEAYGGGCWVIDRKTGERRFYFVERVSVSVTGTIQPGTLARALTPEFLNAGGASRLLMVMPPRTPKRWNEEEVSEEAEKDYHDLLDRLFRLEMDRDKHNGELKPHVIKMDDKAKNLWVAFYNEWAVAQTDVEGEMAACYSKLEGVALRLALVHHVTTHVHLETDDLRPLCQKSMQAGIDLARWFAHEARRVYGMLGESGPDRKTRTLVEFVRNRGGKITNRDLQRSNNRRYRTADEAEADLQGLVLDGLAEWQPESAGPKGGRPSRVCVLLPCTTHDKTDTTHPGDAGEGGRADDGLSDTTPFSQDGAPPGTQNPNESGGFVSSVMRRAGANGTHHARGGQDGSVKRDGVVSGGAEGVSSDGPVFEGEL